MLHNSASRTAALFATLSLLPTALMAEEIAPSRLVHRAESLSSIQPLGQDLYFTVFQGGAEPILRRNTLFRSDGTPEGTRSVAEICGGPNCGGGGILGTWGSTLYWRTLSSTSYTNQLWAQRLGGEPELLASSEPFAGGAFDFRELAPGIVAFRSALFSPPDRAAIYTTNGTAAGTLRLDDGTSATLAQNYGESWVWQGSLLYLSALGNLSEVPANPAGPLPQLQGTSPQPIASFGAYLLYRDYDFVDNKLKVRAVDRQGRTSNLFQDDPGFLHVIGVYGRHLLIETTNETWATDGTPAGTLKMPRLTATSWPRQPYQFAKVGSRLFYLGDDSALAVSDLTREGSYEILPLAGPNYELTRVGDHVVFGNGPFLGNTELAFSDGTVAGTRVFELEPGELGSLPTRFYNLDDRRVVFAATTAAQGSEPWISDGTPEGTYRLDDVVAGPASSNPRFFTRVGNRLFFIVDAPTAGEVELRVLDLPAARPACPADRLCLLNGRFEVTVRALTSGQEFVGKRAFGISESGIFTFFSPNNWEFLVKVLDGCALNDHFWVYASAATDVAYELEVKDRASGEIKTYTSNGGAAARPILDGQAFGSCGLEAPAAEYSVPEPLLEEAHRCADDLTELCLDDRFRVKAEWRTATGSGKALPVATGSADSGLFTFFSPSNWELMVKVLDGCDLNDHHWVFAAGTTDVAWTLTVKDQTTGETKVYTNALGNPSKTITDIEALGGCP